MSPEDYAEDLAKEAMGNWRKFGCFAWRNIPEDGERWAIVYTHNRDSGLCDQSNAAFIERVLEGDDRFEADIRRETHNHWACGWIAGYAIRVRRENGEFTEAWKAYAALQARIADYPLLDEDDYGWREHETACEWIASEMRALGADEDVTGDVFSWLWENEPDQCENRDDQGAAPDREAAERACIALGLLPEEEDS